jgi:hypothetical protein
MGILLLLQSMLRYRFLFSVLFILFADCSSGQRPGGQAVFNFLGLSNAPQLSALGNVNVSNISDDVALGFHNPALLRKEFDRTISVNFNSMYAGIKNYQLSTAFFASKPAITFSAGISYLDYGSIPQTDALGNELGTFRPGDYVVHLSASRQYSHRIRYGATIKYISSNYGLYKANGIAVDAGVVYSDSSKRFQASIVLKNMGVQLRTYTDTKENSLPFDLQVGITKRLADAPVQFSLTAHHLHQFNIRYRDTLFNNENGFPRGGNGFADNLFRHFIAACQVYVGERLEITGAYNHLRRAELSIPGATNGLNGFSLGVGALFSKMQLRYARSYYQGTSAYNHLGINLNFRELTLKRQ